MTAPTATTDHVHASGWGGAPGQCGASCSCGETYDGFDTLGEAVALLDAHIVDSLPADIATLTHAEAEMLAECEQVIERGLQTFVEVGLALAKVRDSRLYRDSHGTFEVYLEERWQISRRRGYQLMESAEAVCSIEHTGLPAPERESQARELAKVPEPERAEVWRETVERTEGKPTAAAVAETAKRAAVQRDARALLRRIVDLAASPAWDDKKVEAWTKQLGPYDEELAELLKRAIRAIAVLDQVIEEAGQ